MLRFLSRRKPRSGSSDQTDSRIKSERIYTNKNVIPCRVILLDGRDLPVDLSVSGIVIYEFCIGIHRLSSLMLHIR